MKKYQLTIFTIAIGLLAGCGFDTGVFGNQRPKTMEDVMSSWEGFQESELVSKWGSPNSSYQNKDGSTILTWKTHNETRDYYGTCSQNYMIDNEGIIIKWGYSGFCRGMSTKGTLSKSTPIPQPTL